MEEGFLVLTEKDWEKMSPEQKGWASFNTMQRLHSRLCEIEKRPMTDKVYSLAGGVIGGFAAALGIKGGGVT